MIIPGGCEVSYQNQDCTLNGTSVTHLDNDVTSAPGKETIHVDSGAPPGIYRHFVSVYGGYFENGQAKVALYKGSNKVDDITSPLGNGTLKFWNTLYFDTSRNTYTIINRLSAVSVGS
jgi:hypothetical protein